MKINKEIKKEIINLKLKGKPSSFIASKFGIGLSTVKNFTIGIGPRSIKSFNTKLSKEKARIHAALVSEGYMKKHSINYYKKTIITKNGEILYKKRDLSKPSLSIRLVFTNKDRSFLNRFINDVKALYGYKPKIYKKSEVPLKSTVSKDLLK